MDVSVSVHRNLQKADMEGYGLQVLVYLVNHHNSERFLNDLMTNYLDQKDVRYLLNVLILSFQYQYCNHIYSLDRWTSMYSIQFGYIKRCLFFSCRT